MVPSGARQCEVVFERWLEHVERLLDRSVDRGAAYKAWSDGYSVREFAAEVEAPPPARAKGNLMTRLVLAALVLLNCASSTTKSFAQTSQTAPPVPFRVPSVNTTSLTCQINCDTQAMNCRNSCVPNNTAAASPVGPAGANAACHLSCSSQQLVCKHRC